MEKVSVTDKNEKNENDGWYQRKFLKFFPGDAIVLFTEDGRTATTHAFVVGCDYVDVIDKYAPSLQQLGLNPVDVHEVVTVWWFDMFDELVIRRFYSVQVRDWSFCAVIREGKLYKVEG